MGRSHLVHIVYIISYFYASEGSLLDFYKSCGQSFFKLPALDNSTGTCSPGILYRKDCRLCLCLKPRNSLCANRCFDEEPGECQLITNYVQAKEIINKEPPLGECPVGSQYHDGCNICFCMEKDVRVCTMRYCSSQGFNVTKLSLAKDKCVPGSIKGSHKRCHTEYCNAAGIATEINLCGDLYASLGPTEYLSLPLIPDPPEVCKNGHLYRSGCKICICAQFVSCFEEHCHTFVEPIPADTELCSPGQMYYNKTARCFCDHNRKPRCSDFMDVTSYPIFRSVFTNKELADMSALPSKMTACVPGQTFKLGCNICFCHLSGSFVCSFAPCSMTSVAVTSVEQCEPGTLFKDGCKQCFCNHLQIRECSEMCDIFVLRDVMAIGGMKSKPIAPQSPGVCSPGVVYREACNLCFCSQDRLLLCEMSACTHFSLPPVHSTTEFELGQVYQYGCKKCIFISEDGDNVMSCSPVCSDELNEAKLIGTRLIVDRDAYLRNFVAFDHLQVYRFIDGEHKVLSSPSEQCSPGHLYKVKCNACVCLINGNTLCNHVVCPNLPKFYTLKMKKLKATPCTSENPAPNCGQCVCKNGKWHCSYNEKYCMTKLSASLQSNSLDPKIEDCQAGMVYQKDCNDCFCRPDRKLQCTQKSCLNRQQLLKYEPKLKMYARALRD